ncbi:hypothetical protein E2M28_23825 [Salmonella enterica subsp. enterica serovar Enteritidis]|nr:hypothetical protein [Salmonella enterica]EBR6587121.1 hypothetical protein [Salmonella enterica]EBU3963834.1 hypothetical protein [Salmonella enterica]ECD6216338.1 hypothetical protein [Salmonella enterica subsp. enterica serovar Enteritidis]
MITPRCGVFFAQCNEDRAFPGLLYGMPLSGTACALRDFAHAQNHPSDGRPHAERFVVDLPNMPPLRAEKLDLSNANALCNALALCNAFAL